MRDLTLILPHFQNVGMLAEQQAVWMAYPPDVRARLHVIVVDDCSPKGDRPTQKHVRASGLASFRIYRLLQKKRWNWLACRNLGASMATTDWLLLTDIDHVLPIETLQAIVAADLNPAIAYRFGRVTVPHPWPYRLADCPPYKRHNDSWLMTRALFNYDDGQKFVKGYDERLSGCYGTSGEFTDRVKACALATVDLNESPLVRYPREVIPDASTLPSVYTRKNDPINESRLDGYKGKRAAIPGWRPLRGLIPHELIYSSDPAEAVA